MEESRPKAYPFGPGSKASGYLKVGELARLAGVSPRTIRYYEEMGLIEPVARSPGGFRLYRSDDLLKLRAIEDLKLLDVSLAGIRALFQKRRSSSTGARSAPVLARWISQQMEMLDFLLDKYKTMKEDMQRTLTILESCAVCDKKPSRDICLDCPAVEKAGRVPPLLAAMM